MLLQMALFHSFGWLSNIPFYICTTSSLSNPLSIDTLVTSTFWLFKEYFCELQGAWLFKIRSQSIFFTCYLPGTAWCWMKCLACVLTTVAVLQSPSHVWLFATPLTVVHQAPLSMGFPRQEYWSGLPFPPPGDCPDPGIEPTSPVESFGNSFLNHKNTNPWYPISKKK